MAGPVPSAKPNGATPSGGADDAPEPTGLDDIFEADADFYEGTDTDDGATDGGADTGGTAADTSVSEAPTQQVTQPRQRAQEQEPEFPGVQFPQQQRPAPQYDPDNPRGYTRVGSLFADDKGNIVSRDGRVMAAAGEPARHWFNMSKQAAQGFAAVKQVEALNKQIADHQNLIAAAKELNELPQKLGISREDYNLGVQLIAGWNRDPLAVCRDMVARTMARGFNATDILGNDAGNAIEMTALRQLVDEATAGQRQRETQERTETENRTNAERNYNAFVARYPLSSVHTSMIAALMRENKVTASEAYHELRYFALENGFDFNQPLEPQMIARKQQLDAQERQQQPAASTQQRATYRAPMVNGSGGGRRDHLTNETAMADPGSSWGEILDSVMRHSA